MSKLSEYTELTDATKIANARMHVIDPSDTTMGPEGSSKSVAVSSLLPSAGLDLHGVGKIRLKGHHLAVQVAGHEYESILPGTPWTTAGGNGTVYMPKMGPLEKRVVTHGNAGDKSGLIDGTWGVPVDGAAPLVVQDFTHLLETSSYRYLAVPAVTYILQRIYYHLGMTLAEVQAHAGVRVRAYYGNIQLTALEADETAGTGLYDDIKFYDKLKTPADMDAEDLSIYTQRQELFINVDEADYPEGEAMTWWIKTIDPAETFKIYTNQDETLPWRAIDVITEEHIALTPTQLIFPAINVTAPADNSVGQSLTPTITSAKGETQGYLVCLKTTGQAGLGANSDITFDSMSGNLGFTSPYVTLKAGVTYRLSAGIGATFTDVAADINYKFVNSSNVALPNSGAGHLVSVGNANGYAFEGTALAIYTPAVDTQVKLRCTFISGGTFTARSDGTWMSIEEVTSKKLDYDIAKSRVRLIRAETHMAVIDETVDGLSYTVPTEKKLSGATDYLLTVDHLNSDHIPVQRSAVVHFKTAFNIEVAINTSVVRNGVTLNLAAGDLIELNVGESLNSVGYQFHVSNQSLVFPAAAYQSEGFRFRDTIGTELNFMVYSVTGIAPNRTAQCFIEVNAKVISDAKLVLAEVV